MKKRKRNQRRHRYGAKAKRQKSRPPSTLPEPLLVHIREVVSLIEGRQISMEEARILAEASEEELEKEEFEKSETTPP